MINTSEKTIKETKEILSRILKGESHLPIMLWGAMGVGKSQAVKQVADDLGWDFIDLRLSLLNPVDLRGLPIPDKEEHRVAWFPPEFLPNGKHDKHGILFLDEINLAPQSVMSAGYQLILDRRLGEYKLPSGWFIVGAGNRAEDKAGVTKFPAPLANRFLHLEIKVDDEEWRRWAIQNGIDEHILAFLGKFPQHLFQTPKAGEKSFPTPRSWEGASNLLALGLPIDPAIGTGVASEFNAFLKVYDKLPDLAKIIKTGVGDVPDELDVLWALVMGLVVRAKPKNLPMIFRYLETLGKSHKDFEMLAVIEISKKSDEIENYLATKSKEFTTWTKRNAGVIEEGSS